MMKLMVTSLILVLGVVAFLVVDTLWLYGSIADMNQRLLQRDSKKELSLWVVLDGGPSQAPQALIHVLMVASFFFVHASSALQPSRRRRIWTFVCAIAFAIVVRVTSCMAENCLLTSLWEKMTTQHTNAVYSQPAPRVEKR